MIKRISTKGYNLAFDTETGVMARWGATHDDDPEMCPLGPEILDVEVSTICNGPTGTPCPWCYKSNGPAGKNMSAETFKRLVEKLPKSVTQVALGIGDVHANPDLWRIMGLCREHGIVPNITVNGAGIDEATAEKLAGICGAVSVSHYGHDDICFGAVQRLTAAGLKQVNLHAVVAAETYKGCFALLDAVSTDPRLRGVKAVVFLLLKPKGKRNKLTPLAGVEEYRKLLDYAQERNVGVGMDSCSAPMALKVLGKPAATYVEPCESGLFSLYVDVNAEAFPCSFSAGSPGWETGIDVLAAEDFCRDVWYSHRLSAWRERLLASSQGCGGCEHRAGCRSCPIYDITPCREKNAQF